ncbi:MAG: ELM1/GtrOC1 family putative glycosyltransferase [Caulobacter sp.]|nr:ELM1/GtrOC1 family putative glycosyltransferase [Caulobacter sp.]
MASRRKSVEAPAPPPLTIWAVSDGRAGIEAQAVGLADAVARQRNAEVVVKRISWTGWTGRLPWWLNLAPRRWLRGNDFAPPWPDLMIAAGRATLPLSIRMRRWTGARTFVVQIQDPRTPLHFFDLVAPPNHDRVKGDNVVSITGSPHRLSPERLKADYAAFADRIDPLPHPRVAVLVGGKSKAFDLSQERAAAIANSLVLPLEQEGGSLLMTFSRRTPQKARDLLAARLRDLPGIVWDGEGANPYFAFLEAADFILVTEDSANMATEAASTGKPVFIVKMDGQHLKFRLLHDELEAKGAARPWGGAFHGWTYEPLQETDRLAGEILSRMDARADAP